MRVLIDLASYLWEVLMPGPDATQARIAHLEQRAEDETRRAEYYRQRWHHDTGVPLMEIAPGEWETPVQPFRAYPPQPGFPPMPSEPPRVLGRDLPPMIKVESVAGRGEVLARYVHTTDGVPVYEETAEGVES